MGMDSIRYWVLASVLCLGVFFSEYSHAQSNNPSEAWTPEKWASVEASLDRLLVEAERGAGGSSDTDSGTDTDPDRDSGVTEEELAIAEAAGFSVDELASVYSEEMVELEDGTFLPLSQDFLFDVYRWSEAPQELKDTWAPFSFIGDSKGYIHLGSIADDIRRSELIEVLEDVSGFGSILLSDGKPMFEKITPVSENGRPMTPVVDGQLDGGVETLYAEVQIAVQGMRLKIHLQITLTETPEGLSVLIENHKGVRAGILGEVLPKGGLYITMDFHSYKNGWLVSGISRFRLNSFYANMIKDPSGMGEYGLSLMEWLGEQVIYPIQ